MNTDTARHYEMPWLQATIRRMPSDCLFDIAARAMGPTATALAKAAPSLFM